MAEARAQPAEPAQLAESDARAAGGDRAPAAHGSAAGRSGGRVGERARRHGARARARARVKPER
eukprot:7215118-Prymnesium_polylepis.1